MSPMVVIMPGTYAAMTFNEVFLHRDLFWISIVHHVDALGSLPSWHLSLSAFLQRLLWETEHHLIIMQPFSGSEQSSYISDNSRETLHCENLELPDKGISKEFTSRLSEIMCSYNHLSFYQCALELIDGVFLGSDHKFEGLKKTLVHWFKILDYVGYDFPQRIPFTRNKLLQKRWGIPTLFSPPKLKPFHPLSRIGYKKEKNGEDLHDEFYIKEENIGTGLYENEDSRLNRMQGQSDSRVKASENNETPTDILDIVNKERGTTNENEFTSLCRSINTTYIPTVPQRFKFDDILLIVVFNFP